MWRRAAGVPSWIPPPLCSLLRPAWIRSPGAAAGKGASGKADKQGGDGVTARCLCSRFSLINPGDKPGTPNPLTHSPTPSPGLRQDIKQCLCTKHPVCDIASRPRSPREGLELQLPLSEMILLPRRAGRKLVWVCLSVHPLPCCC